MGFYRIIKMIFKDILFKIPKKYLVVIIIILTMFLLKTNVKGYSFTNETNIDNNVNYNTLTFYEGIMFKKPLVTDIVIDRYSNFDYKLLYKNFPGYIVPIGFGNNNFDTNIWGVKPNLFYLITPNYSGNKGCDVYINNSKMGFINFGSDIWGSDLNLSVNYHTSYVVENNLMTSTYYADVNNNGVVSNSSITFTNNLVNDSNSPLIFGLYGADCYYINHFITTGQELHNLYPAKNGNKVGLYDFNTSKFYYFTNSSYYTLGNVISRPNVNIGPYIVNSNNEIESYNFNFLNINGNSLKNTNEFGQNYFSLVTEYMGISVVTDLDNFKNINNNSVAFSVPKSELIDNPSIQTGRSVNWKLIYYKSVEGGRDIIEYDLGTYTFDLSCNTDEENNTIVQDQTLGAIAGLNNSINQTNENINNMNNNISNVVTQQEETNNFLQDTTTNDSDFNINTPSVSNEQISTRIDNTITDIFNIFIDIANGYEGSTSVTFHLPNFITGGSTEFLTINSGIVKNFLENLYVFNTQLNMLNLIHTFWYVVLGGYLIRLIKKFSNMIYSGEIFNSSFGKKLDSEYTKITSDIL